MVSAARFERIMLMRTTRLINWSIWGYGVFLDGTHMFICNATAKIVPVIIKPTNFSGGHVCPSLVC